MLTRLFFVCFLLSVGSIHAQKLYSGIVVDSAQMTDLRDVHVAVKGKGKVTSSNSTGGFLIYAQPIDTLIFSSVGYITTEVPLLFEEEALFVLMREDRILLNEITIKSTRLYPNQIVDRTKTAPRKMSGLDGFISPMDYFLKSEREKRKLSRVVEENNRTQTFRQVITDPDVKSIFMSDYELSEEVYYKVIEKFNIQHAAVHYFTDPDAIMESLHDFFSKYDQ